MEYPGLSIDIIIPSFRLQSEYLCSIVGMDVPEGTIVRYLIVADNPASELPADFIPLIDNEKVIVFRNVQNGGSSKSRNVGLDHSKAEWILFLDDDVRPDKQLLHTYSQAIREKPGVPGFFGTTLFPPPSTVFSKGVIACDILTFFFLAGYYSQLKWAPTSNVIVRRSLIGNIRFQEIFPKNGGGEDIDFFLKIYRTTGKELQCLKNAPVYHGWWFGEKRNYTRFTRWSYGDALLHEIFPEYTYYNFPNIVECMVLAVPSALLACMVMHSMLWLACTVPGIIAGECIVEFIRLLIYKGPRQSRFAIEAVLIRASNDIGRFTMQLMKLKRLQGVCQRFDHFCDGRHIRYQQFWAGIKFISYVLFSFVLYCLFR